MERRRSEHKFYLSLKGVVFAAETCTEQGQDSEGEWWEYHRCFSTSGGRVQTSVMSADALLECQEITRESAKAQNPGLFVDQFGFPTL